MKKGIPYIIITALLFATFEPVTKLISGDVHPLVLNLMRFFIGSVVLLPLAIHNIKKAKLKLRAYDFFRLLLLGICVVCLSMTFLTYAVRESNSPTLIAILFSTNSVMTIVLSFFILKDKITVKKIIGVLICLVGIIVCSDISAASSAKSIALALIAALCFSLYTCLSKKMMSEINGITQNAISFFMGSVVLFIIVLIMQPIKDVEYFTKMSTESILVLLYIGIAITGLGYYCYSKALQKTSAMSASLVFFIKPVVTPFFAIILIPDTKLTARVFIALALVVAGSVVATYKKPVKTRVD